MKSSKWGDLCELRYGKAIRDYPGEPSDEHRFRVFGTNGAIGWTSQPLCDHGGIIIGRKGAYRGVHFSADPFFVIDTAYYLEPTSGEIDLKWAYYKLLTVDINRMDVGAAIPTTNRDEFYALGVRYPDLHTQQKISDILSAYDDLIENNRRRVLLLQEAAWQLYCEWFVRLRFPGHEHACITAGVPEGWHWARLDQVCVEGDGIQTGPFGSQLHQSDYTEDGVPVVMPKDLIDLRISEDSIARIPEELADQLGRHRMLPGDTVYGRRGDIGRRAFIRPRQMGWFCGTGCLRFRPDTIKVNERYLFDTLGSPQTAAIIANRAKGSTMPNLSAGALKSVPILLAPRMLQDMYALQVEASIDLRENLSEQNGKLRAARDLLLPRLMSGEIAV